MVDGMIRLFGADETAFSTNGLGSLYDASKCEVAEERNGAFELEMEYHISGRRYRDLQLRGIIVAKPNPYADPQPFRIYEISKPINGLVTVKAEHISYDMAGYPVSPFSASGASAALSGLSRNAIVSNPFRFSTDVSASGGFSTQKAASMRSLLGGQDGSILNIYGGEYEFDGFRVILHAQRGRNRGVTIRYGKNMTDLREDENGSSVYTAVYPFWYSDEWGFIELPEKTVAVPGTHGFTRVYPLDLSGEWKNNYEWEDEYPTEDEIRELAQKFITENKIGIPTTSLTVSFEQLSQSGEYADLELLETVRLCDTVSVEFPKLGVKESLKCIKTTYDALAGRYVSIELGDPTANLSNGIVSRDIIINKIGENITGIHEDITGVNKDVDGLNVLLERTNDGLKAEISRAKGEEERLSSSFTMTLNEIKLNVSETYQTKSAAASNYQSLQSEIQLTSQSIRSTVSATYQTKSAAASNYQSLQSEILQTANSITSTVSATYETKSNAGTEYQNLKSQITQTANSITSTVSATYETKSNAGTKYDSFQTQINQTATQISLKVSAGEVTSLIEQNAGSIRLKSSAIVVDSTYFSVSSNGYITATSGKIGGLTIDSSALYGSGIYITSSQLSVNDISARSGNQLGISCSVEISDTLKVDRSVYLYGVSSGDTASSAAAIGVTPTGYVAKMSGSSRRFKNSITGKIKESLSPRNLLDIGVYQYRYNKDHLLPDDYMQGKDTIGFIAEEIAEKYPIAAIYDGDNVIDWNMKFVIPPMLALIQEAYREITTMKKQLKKILEKTGGI